MNSKPYTGQHGHAIRVLSDYTRVYRNKTSKTRKIRFNRFVPMKHTYFYESRYKTDGRLLPHGEIAVAYHANNPLYVMILAHPVFPDPQFPPTEIAQSKQAGIGDIFPLPNIFPRSEEEHLKYDLAMWNMQKARVHDRAYLGVTTTVGEQLGGAEALAFRKALSDLPDKDKPPDDDNMPAKRGYDSSDEDEESVVGSVSQRCIMTAHDYSDSSDAEDLYSRLSRKYGDPKPLGTKGKGKMPSVPEGDEGTTMYPNPDDGKEEEVPDDTPPVHPISRIHPVLLMAPWASLCADLRLQLSWYDLPNGYHTRNRRRRR